MVDHNKTKAALIEEIEQLRAQLAALQNQTPESPATSTDSGGRFFDFYTHHPDAILIEDMQGRVIAANPAACHLFGYQSEEWKSLNAYDLVPEQHHAELEHAIQDKAPHSHHHMQLIGKDGRIFEAAVHTFIVTNAHEPQAHIHVRPTTPPSANTPPLFNPNQAQLQALFTHIQETILIANNDGYYVAANPAASTLLGYPHDELIGCFIGDLLVDASSGTMNELWTSFLQTGYQRGEITLQHQSGRHIQVDYQAIANFYPGLHLSVMRDITQRKKIEQNFLQTQHLLEQSQRLAQLGSWMWDLQTNAITWSHNMYRLHGLNTTDLQVPEIISLVELVHPDDRVRVRHGLQEIATEVGQHTTEYRIVRADNQQTRILHAEIETINDETGLPIRVIGTVQDVTEQRQAVHALNASNEQLNQTLTALQAAQATIVERERLAAIGQLSTGIAHDFNNILTGMMGFAELLQYQPDLLPESRQKITYILDQGQRAAHLIRQILDFSRTSIRWPKPLNLPHVLREHIAFLRRTIPEDIDIQVDIQATEAWIQGDTNQLQQVLTNLLVNARDAMPAGGQVLIALRHVQLADTPRLPCSDLMPGSYICLAVSDTGEGISAEILPHIFEPFFTTREIGAGSGLGLAQVYGIVRQHDGCIFATSDPDRQPGATFTMYFPAISPPEPTEAIDEAALLPGEDETILLIEDDEAVLATTQAMLQQLNYQVIAASNGQTALAQFTEHRKRIDLVITDLVMPSHDGLSLLRHFREAEPALKFILMSGYPFDEKLEGILVPGQVSWLQKPFSRNELTATLRSLLIR